MFTIKKNKKTNPGENKFNFIISKAKSLFLWCLCRSIITLGFLISPITVFAGWKLEVGIPPLTKNAEVSLGDYVTGVYDFAAMAVGIIGVLMFLVGGFQYMISAGNRGMSGEARKTMTNAIIGIILVLGAWLFLSTINRDLVNFEGLNFK